MNIDNSGGIRLPMKGDLQYMEPSNSDEYMHSHHIPHSHANKKAVINRLSKAIGHLESIRKMVENDRDCSEVLIQLSAVKAAINSTGKVILKEHLNHCIVDAVANDDFEALENFQKAIDQFVK